jgi:hypothetical protein
METISGRYSLTLSCPRKHYWKFSSYGSINTKIQTWSPYNEAKPYSYSALGCYQRRASEASITTSSSSFKSNDLKVSAIMRLSATLLPALVGAASAASEDANVYLFSADSSPSSNPPTLTPEQARLVFAQRLGVSQYHGLGDASDSTLSYINQFGGRREESLFGEPTQDQAAELVLVVEGVSGKSAGPLLNIWELIKPAFTISNPPSTSANKKLALDLNQQSGEKQNCALEDAINPYEAKCWSGKSKVIHFDLAAKVLKKNTGYR